MDLDDVVPQRQVHPGRKRLMMELEKKEMQAKIMMGPRLRSAQTTGKLYGDTDMGSKRYTMEPVITVNVHWGELKQDDVIDPIKMKLHSFCLGTSSFQVDKNLELTKRESDFLNKAFSNLQRDDFTDKKLKDTHQKDIKESMDVDSDESSTWGDIPEV